MHKGQVIFLECIKVKSFFGAWPYNQTSLYIAMYAEYNAVFNITTYTHDAQLTATLLTATFAVNRQLGVPLFSSDHAYALRS